MVEEYTVIFLWCYTHFLDALSGWYIKRKYLCTVVKKTLRALSSCDLVIFMAVMLANEVFCRDKSEIKLLYSRRNHQQ
jgi:hypothetical protein